MASFERFRKENNGYASEPLKSTALGIIVDGNHTDIVINDYSDRIFIIITQYKKLGSFITVYKETARTNSGDGEVYQVRYLMMSLLSPHTAAETPARSTGLSHILKTIQGKEDPDWELATRYLTEQTRMKKPVMYSICLKDCSLRTLKAIRDIILQNKTW